MQENMTVIEGASESLWPKWAVILKAEGGVVVDYGLVSARQLDGLADRRGRETFARTWHTPHRTAGPDYSPLDLVTEIL